MKSFKITTIILLIFATLKLTSCNMVSTGAVNMKGRAAKVEIQEYGNGIMVQGYKISINSEYIGIAMDKGRIKPIGMRNAREYGPLQSKYGEIRLVMNGNMAIGEPDISYDIFIDGDYSGTLHSSNSFR